MNKSVFLSQDDLISIFKVLNYWDCRSFTSPSFYNIFLNDTIQYITEIDTKIYQNNLNFSSNKVSYNSIQNDAKKFVEIFADKIQLPETFTIFKITSNSCSSTYQKKIYKEFMSFLENKIGKEAMCSLCESYILTYGAKSNSVIFSYWFEQIKTKKLFSNFSIVEKIINDFLKVEPNNTVTRNYNLKLLIFINKYKDNSDVISNYVEKHQGDGVFIKGVDKLLSKVKNINWNKVDTPIFNSKSIVGTINFNSEYFIKEYGMTRSEADKFLQLSLSFLYAKLKDFSLNYTSTDLMINAKDVNNYSYKEKEVLDLFDKIKILGPYWKNIKNKHSGIEFFHNHFEKINTHRELIKEIDSASSHKIKEKKIKL